MGSSPAALQGPPSSAPDQGGSPTQGQTPAPPQPAPAANDGAVAALGVVRMLRQLSAAYPGTSEGIMQIMQIMQSKVMPKIAESQQPGESQAPPTG